MNLALHPVILCGGSGTRLWPLSRELIPKQLLALLNEYSLLQNTEQRYVASAEHYLNSGMSVFRASDFLNELKLHRPDILSASRAAMAVQQRDQNFIRIDAAAFSACPNESINYAVMEETDRAAVVALNAGWSDIGSFASPW